MNCLDIARILDEHRTLNLSPFEKSEFQQHISNCEACSSAVRAARLLSSYGESPTPAARPDFFVTAMRNVRKQSAANIGRRSFWWGAAAGSALAASLALFAILTLSPDAPRAIPDSPPVRMALNEVRNVSVAIESAEALQDVDVLVELTGGIRLDRADGRRAVAWRTDLSAGINRLTLPVAAFDDTGGDVRVQLVHASGRKTFIVHVDIGSEEIAEKMEPIIV
jgi:hypothetical protein